MSDPSPYVVLDAAGWSVTNVDGDPTNGKIRYGKDDWELRVNWRRVAGSTSTSPAADTSARRPRSPCSASRLRCGPTIAAITR